MKLNRRHRRSVSMLIAKSDPSVAVPIMSRSTMPSTFFIFHGCWDLIFLSVLIGLWSFASKAGLVVDLMVGSEPWYIPANF